MRKSLFAATGLFLFPFLCAIGFIVLFVTFVAASIPQLPAWAQDDVEDWMMGTPMPTGSESTDNGSSPAGSTVGWDGYIDPNDPGPPDGLPLADEPWLGCVYHDPRYSSHTGVDFPAYTNTPVHATMAGKVVFVGPNGAWGNLVVIENNGHQIWLAHLNAFEVYKGQIVSRGDVVAFSGDTGNSTGPHLHYGVQQQSDSGRLWLNPAEFFGDTPYIKIACSE